MCRFVGYGAMMVGSWRRLDLIDLHPSAYQPCLSSGATAWPTSSDFTLTYPCGAARRRQAPPEGRRWPQQHDAPARGRQSHHGYRLCMHLSSVRRVWSMRWRRGWEWNAGLDAAGRCVMTHVRVPLLSLLLSKPAGCGRSPLLGDALKKNRPRANSSSASRTMRFVLYRRRCTCPRRGGCIAGKG